MADRSGKKKAVDRPWARSVEEILRDLDVSGEEGLPSSEVEKRRKEYGPNLLREAKTRSVWDILLAQFRSMVIIVLAVAAVIAFLFQEVTEGIAISAVLLVNAVIGFVSEWRAMQSMDALRKTTEVNAKVWRNGEMTQVPAMELVPGDILMLEGGDMVTADARVTEANKLQLKEAALTGESVPVDKTEDAVAKDATLADRNSMLYSGTTVTRGSAAAVVVGTGIDTEIGHISELTETAGEKERTPLERQLNKLGRRMAWAVVASAAVIALLGILSGRDLRLMVETAIALGIAAVPEGLPIVATIALARGMWLMSKRNALINRLNAVETLGATSIIFTDKTGTLTEEKMRLKQLLTANDKHEFGEAVAEDRNDPLLRYALEIGVLCNNASVKDDDHDRKVESNQGDPTEVALLQAGLDLNISREKLLDRQPEEREEAFDSEVMMMATYHRLEKQLLLAVKGAPYAVLEVCSRYLVDDKQSQDFTAADRDKWNRAAEELATQGLRVLAIADKHVDSSDAEPYEDLRFVALVGLLDPPRADVKQSIEACQKAGITIVMVTGDQAATAAAIGQQLGLIDDDSAAVMHGRDIAKPEDLSDDERQKILSVRIFARVSPEQKLNLLKIYQQSGQTVAMTGDGVNDAPALKEADIGVAMGQRGTDAARQAADMVLRDDAFASITAAVEQGRIIFGNIRKSVLFMLCTNIAEVIAVTIAALANLPLPLRPLQILFLNVITDVFPALALGMGKGNPHVMDEKPRPHDEGILSAWHWRAIFGWGIAVAIAVLGALLTAHFWMGMQEKRAITISFMTLGFSKLWFVFILRSPQTKFRESDVVRNPWIWGALIFCTVLLLAAVYMPMLSDILQTVSPGLQGWLLIVGISAMPWLAGFIGKLRPIRQQGLRK